MTCSANFYDTCNYDSNANHDSDDDNADKAGTAETMVESTSAISKHQSTYDQVY